MPEDKARLGERVLLVPQAAAGLMNEHRQDQCVIGKPPVAVTPVLGNRATDGHPAGRDRWTAPTWLTFTSTTLRRGYGVLVVRDGVLRQGPSLWDSGD